MFYTSFFFVVFLFCFLIDLASEIMFTGISLIGKEAAIKKTQMNALELIFVVSVWLIYCSFSVQNTIFVVKLA